MLISASLLKKDEKNRTFRMLALFNLYCPLMKLVVAIFYKIIR